MERRHLKMTHSASTGNIYLAAEMTYVTIESNRIRLLEKPCIVL
jgi:hypothetical protein